jgi:hypothetical protein
MSTEDPVLKLLDITRRIVKPLATLLTVKNASEFDSQYTSIEADLKEWNSVLKTIDPTKEPQVIAGSKIKNTIDPLLNLIHEKSIELGATKGQKLAVAPAAGGRYKRTRKMTRKYCKKTPCRKMGFTQKASCRPYKNCYKNKK